jgi:hypothetical protein
VDKRLERIEAKQDTMQQDITEIKLGYREHERRSIANERAVEMLSEQFKPVHELLIQVRLLHRIIVALGAAAGAVYALVELKHELQKMHDLWLMHKSSI